MCQCHRYVDTKKYFPMCKLHLLYIYMYICAPTGVCFADSGIYSYKYDFWLYM